MTQEEFAEALGCTTEHIVALETNKERATFEFAVKLTEVFNLHGAPITESARTTLMDRLSTWKHQINYGLVHKAAGLKPELEKAALSSYSPSTENFYYLHLADYYRLANDMPAYNETMELLGNRSGAFGIKHKYYYYRLLGVKAYVEKRHNEAIRAYEAAIALDKDKEWHDVRLYYGIAVSLSDSGFATRALMYFKEAKQLAQHSIVYGGKPNSRYDVYIDGYMGYDMSRLGRSDEALPMVRERLKAETSKQSKDGMGYSYFSLGRIYHRIKDYYKAEENYENALKYLASGGVAYMAVLFGQASLMVSLDRIAKAAEYAEIGLSVATNDYWKVYFEALKQYTQLQSNIETASHMAEALIPKLVENRQYEAAVFYYQKLGEYYREKGSLEDACKYFKHALEVQIKLQEELLEGILYL